MVQLCTEVLVGMPAYSLPAPAIGEPDLPCLAPLPPPTVNVVIDVKGQGPE